MSFVDLVTDKYEVIFKTCDWSTENRQDWKIKFKGLGIIQSCKLVHPSEKMLKIHLRPGLASIKLRPPEIKIIYLVYKELFKN